MLRAEARKQDLPPGGIFMARDLTRGNPFKLMLAFSLPIFIGNVFQQLYNMADTLIVGRTVSSDAMSGVGCTGAVSFLVLGLVWGLTTGFAVRTSQLYGAKDYDGMRKSVAVSLELCVVMTILLTALAVPMTNPLLRMMKTPEIYFEYAYFYLLTIFAGIGATILYNIAASTLRAVGDSRTPLIFLIISAVLNVGLDFVCIVFLKMSYTGAGVATVVSQLISGAASLIYMFHAYPELKPRKKDWIPDFPMIRGHISIGLPMALQFSITAIGCIFQQSALNSLHSSMPGVVTAYTAASKIDNIACQPLNALGTAMATYAGQNYGAKEYGRIKDGVFAGMVYSVISWFAGMAFCIGLAKPLTAMFINKEAGEAALFYTDMLKYSKEFLVYQSVFYIGLGIIFIYRNALQGIGRSALTMVAGVTELAGRSLTAFIFVKYIGYTGVCLSNPVAWVAADIFLMAAYYAVMRKYAGQRAYSLKTLFHRAGR